MSRYEVEPEKKYRILKVGRVQHIECECGFDGQTHTGACPRCGATEIMPEENLQLLATHRENVKANKNVSKSLQDFESATQGGNNDNR